MLNAYLNRLGLSRSEAQACEGLDALKKITRAHLEKIPFENVDALTGTIPSLEPDVLCKKLLVDCRGGYCFETNKLMYMMLKELGFKVKPFVSYIMLNRPLDSPGPRAHMAMAVVLDDQEYLADVGMGGWSIRDPLALRPDVEQVDEGTGEVHRVLSSPLLGHIVQRKLPASAAPPPSSREQVEQQPGDNWASLFAFFDTKPALKVDFDMGNQFAATYPHSPFVVGPLGGRVLKDRRISLYHRLLMVQPYEAAPEMRMFESPQELLKFYEGVIGIVMPNDEVRATFLKRLHETWDIKEDMMSSG